jgi:hypothetical protein
LCVGLNYCCCRRCLNSFAALGRLGSVCGGAAAVFPRRAGQPVAIAGTKAARPSFRRMVSAKLDQNRNAMASVSLLHLYPHCIIGTSGKWPNGFGAWLSAVKVRTDVLPAIRKGLGQCCECATYSRRPSYRSAGRIKGDPCVLYIHVSTAQLPSADNSLRRSACLLPNLIGPVHYVRPSCQLAESELARHLYSF